MNPAFTHTPPPWHIDGQFIRPSEGHHITEVEREANAHLVAAAPDLLAALLYVRDAVEAGRDIAMSRINAAIAKAEGRA